VVAAPRVVAIVGPTASGKSALALAVARDGRGEIVSCDSLQVYRGLDVGSAKATADERAMVPHHLLDVVEPDQDVRRRRFSRIPGAIAVDVLKYESFDEAVRDTISAGDPQRDDRLPAPVERSHEPHEKGAAIDREELLLGRLRHEDRLGIDVQIQSKSSARGHLGHAIVQNRQCARQA